MAQLKALGILSTATFCTKHLKGFPIASDKELKNEDRGSYDYRSDVNSVVHVMNWHDNKCVYLASTFFGVAAAGTVKRSDTKEKSYIDVSLSDMVLDYNTAMGDIDLADMLIALYRTKIMVKRRWHFEVIFHALNICKINGWLLYRRQCDQQAVPKNIKNYCLHSFQTWLGHSDL